MEGRAGRAARASSRTTRDLADGLLALYEATFDERWFVAARELADAILDHFTDPAGGFFDTADDHEALVTRPKDLQDNATPAGSSMATLVLLRLAALTGESRYREAADAAIATVTPYLARYPTGFANWLSAAHLAVDGHRRAGDRRRPGRRSHAGPDRRRHRAARRAGRNLVVAVSADPDASAVPLLAGSDDDRRPSDRLPLPELRLSPAGHRPRRARRGVRALGVVDHGAVMTMTVPLLSASGSWFADGW